MMNSPDDAGNGERNKIDSKENKKATSKQKKTKGIIPLLKKRSREARRRYISLEGRGARVGNETGACRPVHPYIHPLIEGDQDHQPDRQLTLVAMWDDASKIQETRRGDPKKRNNS